MNFLHSTEQRMLRDSIAGALATAEKDQILSTLANLGIFSALTPEHCGGSGLGLVEGAIILEAAGRAGVVYPLAATIALADAASSIHPDQRDAIQQGKMPIDVATSGQFEWVDGYLRGELTASNVDSLCWLAVPICDQRLALVNAHCLAGQPRHAVTIGERAVTLVINLPVDACGLISKPRHRDILTVLQCAELLGAAAHLFDLSTAYLKDREQFGRPIGANQALKHMAADCYVLLENIRVAVEFAAAALDAAQAAPGDTTLDEQAAQALRVMRAYAPGAARKIAETAVQFHGGIGLTWEYQLNGYLRRIIRLGMQLGDGAQQRRALLQKMLGLSAFEKNESVLKERMPA